MVTGSVSIYYGLRVGPETNIKRANVVFVHSILWYIIIGWIKVFVFLWYCWYRSPHPEGHLVPVPTQHQHNRWACYLLQRWALYIILHNLNLYEFTSV